MNKKFPNSDRGPWDFVMFGVTFYGFILALGGIVAASRCAAVIGLIAMLLGLHYFGLQQWLSD